jgi:UDP-N-acetylglucosamine 2-epimerase (non-hydrolysing)
MLKKIEDVLLKEQPNMVLVFGDTNTTIAGALAAVKLHIPVAHIESGLRSYDRKMPEEINRVLTDHCSNILFCPTNTAIDNLRKEGITTGVYLTGDVMVEAINQHVKLSENNSKIYGKLGISHKKYFLATIHRAENTDDPMRLSKIVDAFCKIDDLVFPCHPRTEKYLKNYGLWNRLNDSIKLIKPVGYLDMLMLERGAMKILTDSGGIQKESYILRVPCITLRSTTEWVETLSDGWNILVDDDNAQILRAVKEMKTFNQQKNVFGDGDASKKICKILMDYS